MKTILDELRQSTLNLEPGIYKLEPPSIADLTEAFKQAGWLNWYELSEGDLINLEYRNDYVVTYHITTQHLTLWEPNSHADLWRPILKKQVHNQTIVGIKKLARLMQDELEREAIERIGNNGEDVVEYNEDEYER